MLGQDRWHQVVILNRVVKVGIIEKVTFEQALGRGERMSQIAGRVRAKALRSSMSGETNSLNCGYSTASRASRGTHSLPLFFPFLPSTSHHLAYCLYICIIYLFIYLISAYLFLQIVSSMWTEILLVLVHCCIFQLLKSTLHVVEM